MITEEEALEYEIGRATLIKSLIVNNIMFYLFERVLLWKYKKRYERYRRFHKLLTID